MPIMDTEQLAHRQHAIPQNIRDVEFKIIGSLTMRQFMYLLVFGLFAYGSWAGMQPPFNFFAAAVLAGLGLLFAFAEFGNRRAEEWTVNAIKALFSENQKVWKKTPKLPAAFTLQNIEFMKHEIITLTPTSSRRKLEEFLERRVKDQKEDPLDIPELEYARKVKEVFSTEASKEIAESYYMQSMPNVAVTPPIASVPDLTPMPNPILGTVQTPVQDEPPLQPVLAPQEQTQDTFTYQAPPQETPPPPQTQIQTPLPPQPQEELPPPQAIEEQKEAREEEENAIVIDMSSADKNAQEVQEAQETMPTPPLERPADPVEEVEEMDTQQEQAVPPPPTSPIEKIARKTGEVELAVEKSAPVEKNARREGEEALAVEPKTPVEKSTRITSEKELPTPPKAETKEKEEEKPLPPTSHITTSKFTAKDAEDVEKDKVVPAQAEVLIPPVVRPQPQLQPQPIQMQTTDIGTGTNAFGMEPGTTADSKLDIIKRTGRINPKFTLMKPTTPNEQFLPVATMTPDQLTGRRFTNLVPGQGKIVLPIRGEKVIDAYDLAEGASDANMPAEPNMENKTKQLQQLLDQIKSTEQGKEAMGRINNAPSQTGTTAGAGVSPFGGMGSDDDYDYSKDPEYQKERKEWEDQRKKHEEERKAWEKEKETFNKSMEDLEGDNSKLGEEINKLKKIISDARNPDDIKGKILELRNLEDKRTSNFTKLKDLRNKLKDIEAKLLKAPAGMFGGPGGFGSDLGGFGNTPRDDFGAHAGGAGGGFGNPLQRGPRNMPPVRPARLGNYPFGRPGTPPGPGAPRQEDALEETASGRRMPGFMGRSSMAFPWERKAKDNAAPSSEAPDSSKEVPATPTDPAKATPPEEAYEIKPKEMEANIAPVTLRDSLKEDHLDLQAVDPSYAKGMQGFTNTPNVVAGVVLSPEGKPVENTVIIIKNQKEEPVRALKTNKLGQFYISTPLIEGKYFVEIDKSGKSGWSFDIINIEASGNVIPPVQIIGKTK